MVAYNRIIEITPTDYLAKVIKGHSYLRWTGSVDTLEAMLKTIPSSWDEQGMATYAWYTVFRIRRQYREGLAMLDRYPTELSWDTQVYHPKALMRADMYEGMRDTFRARLAYEEARVLLEDSLAAHPHNPSIHAALGLVHAGLGRKRDAIREADRSMAMVPVSGNSIRATAFMGIAIETLARAGELDRPFEMIELMLSMPSGREVTVPFLRVWPGFDPLRKDPRFDQLLERFTVK
jgi:hypothetical protein